MKSYAEEYVTSFKHLLVPYGDKFPRGAQIGEMFHLTVDEPETNTMNKWHSRGTYVYDGRVWDKLNDAARVRKSVPLGSQTHEFEIAGNPKGEIRANQGHQLVEMVVRPSHRKATLSGAANFWVDTSIPALVWVTVFSAGKIKALTAQHVNPGELRSMAVSFVDIPGSPHDQTYVIKVNMNAKGFLFINTSNSFTFDGIGSTAFIVGEDVF